MISVLVVRLVVDEVGLPKELLFCVLELADHVNGLLLVLVVEVVFLVAFKKKAVVVGGYQNAVSIVSERVEATEWRGWMVHYRNLIAAAAVVVVFWAGV